MFQDWSEEMEKINNLERSINVRSPPQRPPDGERSGDGHSGRGGQDQRRDGGPPGERRGGKGPRRRRRFEYSKYFTIFFLDLIISQSVGIDCNYILVKHKHSINRIHTTVFEILFRCSFNNYLHFNVFISLFCYAIVLHK